MTSNTQQYPGTYRWAGVLPMLCAFISGAAALIYQVVWNRELLLLFGSTSAAAAAVVAAFMGGMGLGAMWVTGHHKSIPRPLRLYAFLEFGVAGYALIFHPLLSALGFFYPALWHAALASPALLNLLRLALGLVLLVPPTFAMGATLPLLVAGVEARLRAPASSVGWIYGTNAAGGALGAMSAGFLLLPHFGLALTVITAVTMSSIAAVIALSAKRQVAIANDGQQSPGVSARYPLRPWDRRIIILALAGSGVASMGYEVIWTRMLVLVTGSSTYAFSLMLALYVAGLGLGSLWIAAKIAKLKAPGVVFGHMVIGVAATVGLGLWLFGRFPDWQLVFYQAWGTSFSSSILIDSLLAAVVILPPTFLLGAIFPVAVELLGLDHRHRVGGTARTLAILSAGNALGALAAGGGLVTWLGLEGALIALAALTFASGFIVQYTRLGTRPGRRVASIAGIILVLAGSTVPLRWNPMLLTSGVYEKAPIYLDLLGGAVRLKHLLQTYQLLDYQEGNQAVVSVIKFPNLGYRPHLALSIDGKVDASTGADMSTQILSAHIGMLLAHSPRNVLVIGLASGITVGSVAQWPDAEHIVVAEISPAVVRAERWFAPFNYNILHDPRVRLAIDDGRHYLSVTHRRYQVVISEPSNPWLSGPARLFTLQFFRLIRQHLTPHGVFVQWLPLYGLSTPLLKAEVRTFLAVFPQAALFRMSAGDLVLVGSVSTFQPSTQVQLPKSVQDDLARVKSDKWRLFARFITGAHDLATWSGPGPLNTDNNGLLEFGAPKYLLKSTLRANLASLKEAPWHRALEEWARAGEVPLARAYLKKGQVQRAKFVATLAPPTPEKWKIFGDIAAVQNEWVTASSYWRQSGTPQALLELAQMDLEDGELIKAAKVLTRIDQKERSPRYYFVHMLVETGLGHLSTAVRDSRYLPNDVDHDWGITASFFKVILARRMADADAAHKNEQIFFDLLDQLRRRLEREHDEPVLDAVLSQLRELPPGILRKPEFLMFETTLQSRVLGPMSIYNRAVSLLFLGRFDEADNALRIYIHSLPSQSGPTYATELLQKIRTFKTSPSNRQ